MSHNRTIPSTHPNAILKQFEDAELDYSVNWAGRLDGDTIASSTWVNEGRSGLTISSESNTTTTSTARITGDTGYYLITNTITLTTSGEKMQQQFQLIIQLNNKNINSDYRDAGLLTC